MLWKATTGERIFFYDDYYFWKERNNGESCVLAEHGSGSVLLKLCAACHQRNEDCGHQTTSEWEQMHYLSQINPSLSLFTQTAGLGRAGGQGNLSSTFDWPCTDIKSPFVISKINGE